MKATAAKFLAVTAALMLGTAAWAGEECAATEGAKKLSEGEVRAKVEEMGYKVKRIKQDHGCYEVKARDKSGQEVELKVSAVDGTVSEEEDD